jgi:hypothetical protein
MNKSLAVFLATILLCSCGDKKTASDGWEQFAGLYFTISHPSGFAANQADGVCTLASDKYGIAITAMKGSNFREGDSNLGSLGQQFKSTYKNPKVEQVQFAGLPALYIESRDENGISFGYSFMLDGALVTVSAQAVPVDYAEEASKILITFELTKKDSFRVESPENAEITQFGPSDGQMIQFENVMLVPPKDWRILDNSTSDFISIEPKSLGETTGATGINIVTVPDSKTGAEDETKVMAQKAGVEASKVKIGEIEYWHYTAEYQQKAYVYMTSFGKRLHIVTITTTSDELDQNMQEFLTNLAFKK